MVAGNVSPGGLHIHHLVFGIVLMMLSGFLNFVTEPPSPWFEILAGVFGVGAGLTLDEFALWLYLDDVYWAEEGRSSVDAVVFAAIIGGAIILGFVPLDASGGSILAIVVSVAISLGICAIVALKGKVSSAVIGMFIPPVAWVAAIRLARPVSWWAKRRYPAGSGKLQRPRRERPVTTSAYAASRTLSAGCRRCPAHARARARSPRRTEIPRNLAGSAWVRVTIRSLGQWIDRRPRPPRVRSVKERRPR